MRFRRNAIPSIEVNGACLLNCLPEGYPYQYVRLNWYGAQLEILTRNSSLECKMTAKTIGVLAKMSKWKVTNYWSHYWSHNRRIDNEIGNEIGRWHLKIAENNFVKILDLLDCLDGNASRSASLYLFDVSAIHLRRCLAVIMSIIILISY